MASSADRGPGRPVVRAGNGAGARELTPRGAPCRAAPRDAAGPARYGPDEPGGPMRHALSRDADIALVPGGAVLRIRGRSVAFEAGEGMAAGLQPDDLRALDGLLVSSGAMADIAGLLPLLHARAAYPGELTLVHPLGDERVGALLEAWDRGFPGRLQVSDDAVHDDRARRAPDRGRRPASGRGRPRRAPAPRVPARRRVARPRPGLHGGLGPRARAVPRARCAASRRRSRGRERRDDGGPGRRGTLAPPPRRSRAVRPRRPRALGGRRGRRPARRRRALTPRARPEPVTDGGGRPR